MRFSRQEYWSGVPIAFFERIETVPFFPVSLVCNNNIILVGKADQLWQPWWEKWILHLPRLGVGGPSLEGMLNGVYMSETGGSGFTHPRDNRAGWAGGPALEFLKPQGSCCLKCGL